MKKFVSSLSSLQKINYSKSPLLPNEIILNEINRQKKIERPLNFTKEEYLDTMPWYLKIYAKRKIEKIEKEAELKGEKDKSNFFERFIVKQFGVHSSLKLNSIHIMKKLKNHIDYLENSKEMKE